MSPLGTTSTGTPPARPLGRGRRPEGGDGNGAGGGRPEPSPGSDQPLWRRRPFLLGGAVVVIVGVAVITDIPLSSTPTTRLSDASATIKEIKSDIAGCNAALGEAFTIYQRLSAGTLTKGQRAESPGILSDDANGCSYTNQSIVDLANLGLPQVSIGKDLSHIAGRALAWTDPDGLTAIYDISTLLRHPGQTKAAAGLRTQVRQLTVDRNAAVAETHWLATQLGGTLPSLGMRVIHLPR